MYSRSVNVKKKTALLYFNAELTKITTTSAASYQYRQRLNARKTPVILERKRLANALQRRMMQKV